ncbi:hypothetical protein SYK_26230 [Pseudodesulfovibrio nedwellii]|uniref:Rhodanese domain-containing protein n=2 Tax=Pseudodesulfovibrio nedwellii TaxID=2973072 RepID=A0ABN6S799_9BACT|nr:hypothetical protein SYK_26230 [Pseudodesulfovibrio nedwellii]
MMIRTSSIVYLLLALCFFGSAPANADENEVWWAAAQGEAEREGYKLIDSKGLKELIDSGATPLIIDARADYEFSAGHIHGSSNMEFDLGDRMDLPEAKRAVLKELAGQDQKRLLVVYCRSFR